MAMPIMVMASVKAVNSKKTASGRQFRERTIVYEGSSGPRELLEAIVIQAQAAVKGLEGVKPMEVKPEEMTEAQKRMRSDAKGKGKERANVTADENARLLQFCKRILYTAMAIDRSLRETKGDLFVERLHAALPKIASSSAEAAAAYRGPVEAGDTEGATQKIYMDWATRVRFEYCDLEVPASALRITEEGGKKIEEDTTPNYKFYYNNEARMLTNSDIPKRSLAIAKEVSFCCCDSQVYMLFTYLYTVSSTYNKLACRLGLVDFPEGRRIAGGYYQSVDYRA